MSTFEFKVKDTGWEENKTSLRLKMIERKRRFVTKILVQKCKILREIELSILRKKNYD